MGSSPDLDPAGIEAAIRASYDLEPQWNTGFDGVRVPRTYEECYGCSPLERKDDREEMEVAIRAYLSVLEGRHERDVARENIEGLRETTKRIGELNAEIHGSHERRLADGATDPGVRAAQETETEER